MALDIAPKLVSKLGSPDSKIPLGNDYYNKPSTLEDLKRHKGNYGIIVGYNHKKNNKSSNCKKIKTPNLDSEQFTILSFT